MSPRLRPLALPFLVEPPKAVRIRTRLQVSDQNALVPSDRSEPSPASGGG